MSDSKLEQGAVSEERCQDAAVIELCVVFLGLGRQGCLAFSVSALKNKKHSSLCNAA